MPIFPIGNDYCLLVVFLVAYLSCIGSERGKGLRVKLLYFFGSSASFGLSGLPYNAASPRIIRVLGLRPLFTPPSCKYSEVGIKIHLGAAVLRTTTRFAGHCVGQLSGSRDYVTNFAVSYAAKGLPLSTPKFGQLALFRLYRKTVWGPATHPNCLAISTGVLR